MKIILSTLRKLVGDINLPYESLRDMGDFVEAQLSQSSSYFAVYDTLMRDIRYDKFVEPTQNGFFVRLRNITETGYPIRADVAVKFWVVDTEITRVTAVMDKAHVFMDNGDVEVAFSRSEALKLLKMNADTARLDKEIRSVV